nr:MAG TPA: hypothetical protein [Caudoviricetes sp.]
MVVRCYNRAINISKRMVTVKKIDVVFFNFRVKK